MSTGTVRGNLGGAVDGRGSVKATLVTMPVPGWGLAKLVNPSKFTSVTMMCPSLLAATIAPSRATLTSCNAPCPGLNTSSSLPSARI